MSWRASPGEDAQHRPDAADCVSFDKDGRFEIRGLPAARYVVQIRLGKGFAVKRFGVPVHSTLPVDIGELKMSITWFCKWDAANGGVHAAHFSCCGPLPELRVDYFLS